MFPLCTIEGLMEVKRQRVCAPLVCVATRLMIKKEMSAKLKCFKAGLLPTELWHVLENTDRHPLYPSRVERCLTFSKCDDTLRDAFFFYFHSGFVCSKRKPAGFLLPGLTEPT